MSESKVWDGKRDVLVFTESLDYVRSEPCAAHVIEVPYRKYFLEFIWTCSAYNGIRQVYPNNVHTKINHETCR